MNKFNLPFVFAGIFIITTSNLVIASPSGVTACEDYLKSFFESSVKIQCSYREKDWYDFNFSQNSIDQKGELRVVDGQVIDDSVHWN